MFANDHQANGSQHGPGNIVPAQTAGNGTSIAFAPQPGPSMYRGHREVPRRPTCLHWLEETRDLMYTNAWDVIRDEFVSDPCAIDHVCTPTEAATDKAKRIGYKKVQEVKGDELYAGRVPRQVYEEMLTKANQEYDEEVVKALYGWGYGMKRRTMSRAINSLKDREVTLENIPQDLARLGDGRMFVHEQSPELHVYFSEETIESACKSGLYAIVADGVHSKQPKELMQLYTVHGVCDGGVEVPILYAMTARKTEDVYLRVFGHLKRLFDIHRPRPVPRMRIILDFEKASIAAVRRLFPEAVVEGCAFHLAQSWNRRRDACNLRKFIDGHGRVPIVAQWWDIVKGVIFLPRRLYPEVRALWTPPVPRDHPAYEKCKDFLDYLHATWFDGPFKDMWNKWEVVDLRTTNTAEAFHNRLNVTIGRDHPDLRTLIEKLKYIDFEAKCSLRWINEHPEEDKHLRKRDKERRENIENSMKRFEEDYRVRGVTRADIESYCINMSRYVSGKTI